MRTFALLACLLLPAHAMAQTMQIDLAPGRSIVALRTYGMGLLPLDGRFARFQGVFRYNRADGAQCSVSLRIDAGSLEMGTAAAGTLARGPDFLNAKRYPVLAYQGACDGGGIAGRLTMHGVTLPFALTLDRDAGHLVAVGRLQRARWGMTARPLLGGRTIRIKVTLPLAEPSAP